MFANQRGINEFNGTPLHWGRADLDGAPYLGNELPLLKQEEAESLLEKASNIYYGTFDTSQPDQTHYSHRLQDILDRRGCRWYNILAWEPKWGERDGLPVMFVFVVWEVPFMRPSGSVTPHATNFLQFRPQG